MGSTELERIDAPAVWTHTSAADSALVHAIDTFTRERFAMDSLSGLTSQPNLGSIVEALRGTERDTGLDPVAIRKISFYFEAVRA